MNIASSANYRPEDFHFQRELNRRDGSVLIKSKPLRSGIISGAVAAIRNRINRPYRKFRSF